jgi:hypothetical protein
VFLCVGRYIGSARAASSELRVLRLNRDDYERVINLYPMDEDIQFENLLAGGVGATDDNKTSSCQRCVLSLYSCRLRLGGCSFYCGTQSGGLLCVPSSRRDHWLATPAVRYGAGHDSYAGLSQMFYAGVELGVVECGIHYYHHPEVVRYSISLSAVCGPSQRLSTVSEPEVRLVYRGCHH